MKRRRRRRVSASSCPALFEEEEGGWGWLRQLELAERGLPCPHQAAPRPLKLLRCMFRVLKTKFTKDDVPNSLYHPITI